MKGTSIVCVFYAVLYLVVFFISAEKNCHSLFDKAQFYLGTKTPYSYIANNVDKPLTFSGCSPKRIWILIRHGTRNPGQKMIYKINTQLTVSRDEIISNHDKGRGKLCNDSVIKLRKWTPQINASEEKILTHEGENEMLELAERYQNRFPELLPELYSNSTYKFRFTATQRTSLSARLFTVGLFGRHISNHVWFPEPLHKDPVLRFYKACEKWKKTVNKNPEALLEFQKFKDSNEMASTVASLSHRLGFNYTLNFGDVHLMYMACAYETAWTPKKLSPWCSVFTEQDLMVMEYSEDLKYYWIDGYGYDINYRQACPALSDMIKHFRDKTLPQAVFYFTHSGTLLKMLCHLQLHKDHEPLTSDGFSTRAKFRKWRVSQVDAFGTNLAFVLYRCSSEEKVLTLHQERPVILPGCPSDKLCPLRKILELYNESVEACSFQEMCSYDPSMP